MSVPVFRDKGFDELLPETIVRSLADSLNRVAARLAAAQGGRGIHSRGCGHEYDFFAAEKEGHNFAEIICEAAKEVKRLSVFRGPHFVETNIDCCTEL